MIKLNIHDAKTHLSVYLANLKQGDTIVLCKRNRPIAEIRPIPVLPDGPRPIGLAKDIFEVPASFFEPLPQSILKDFDGARS